MILAQKVKLALVLFFSLSTALCADGRIERVLDGYLPGLERNSALVQPLAGGLTSQVYLVKAPSGEFVLRFMDENAPLSAILKELWITAHTAENGLSPQILHIDLAQRALLMEYIHPRDSLEIPLLAKTLRSLHSRSPLEPFATLHQKYVSVTNGSFPLPKEAAYLWEKLLNIQEEYSLNEWSICHNDLHALNVLFDSGKYRIIDWTSSGIGIPEFDVVKLIAAWTDEAKESFYEAYYGHAPTAKDRRRLQQMYQVRLGFIFFNRWLHLKNAMSREEDHQVIAAMLENWQNIPLRNYMDCPVDGSPQDLFEGSLSALKEFLLASETPY